MQFTYYKDCVPISPTSPWLGVFRYLNPAFDKVVYSEDIGITYSMKDAFTYADVDRLVRLAPVIRCRIYLTKVNVVEGLLLELLQREGRDVLPVKVEGIFTLLWEKLYAETALANLLHKQPGIVAKMEARVPRYVYGEYRGPTVEDVVFFPGTFVGDPGLTIGEEIYVFSPTQISEERIVVPLSVSHAFFARRPRSTSPLSEAETYRSSATEYSMHYHERHMNQVERILEWLPESGYIEPGCGAGIVVRLKTDVVAGDPHPPAYAHPLVRQETFMDTVRRGRDDMIIVCSYIHTFLTEEEIQEVSVRQVVWIDAPDHQCPGRLVFPGVWMQNISHTPQLFLLEKPVSIGYLQFTENLLNHESFALFRESEYSAYLRVMRPNMPFEHLSSYSGGFLSSYKNVSAPILCANVLDILRAQTDYPDRQIYFSETGRMFTRFLGETDILSDVGFCKIYYQTRTPYRVPVGSPYQFIINYTPHITVGEWFYFYDRCDSGLSRRFKYVTSSHFVKGEIIALDDLQRESLTVEITNNGRVYLKNKVISFSYLFDGTVSGYCRFFFSFFVIGMTRAQFGEISRGLSRIVSEDARQAINLVRQKLEMSDLSSVAILRICGENTND